MTDNEISLSDTCIKEPYLVDILKEFQNKGNTLIFNSSDGAMKIKIDFNLKTIEIDPQMNASEAAQLFWDEVQKLSGYSKS